jgi:hypothetical protein
MAVMLLVTEKAIFCRFCFKRDEHDRDMLSTESHVYVVHAPLKSSSVRKEMPWNPYWPLDWGVTPGGVENSVVLELGWAVWKMDTGSDLVRPCRS